MVQRRGKDDGQLVPRTEAETKTRGEEVPLDQMRISTYKTPWALGHPFVVCCVNFPKYQTPISCELSELSKVP